MDFLRDGYWFILVFSFAWFDNGYMYGVAWVWFYGPLYLAVIYLSLACRRSTIRGLFWEMTSGFAVFISFLGSTVEAYLCQSTEALGGFSRTA